MDQRPSNLHPVLSAALACLDLSLETELAQFRCHQAVKQLSPAALRAAEAAESKITHLDPPSQKPRQAHSQGVEMDLVAAKANPPTPESLLESPPELTAGPNRHLASTQALVRNLEEPQPPTPGPRSWFLRPLRIISLLLLGTSFPVGYLILAAPPKASLLKGASPEVSPTPAASIPPKAKPSEAVQNSPKAIAASDQPFSQPASPKPLPGGNNYYYVIADHPNPEALTQVQRIVPGAYVQDFPEGARIQVGAFDRQKSAQELVEQLEGQGIAAMVRKPQ